MNIYIVLFLITLSTNSFILKSSHKKTKPHTTYFDAYAAKKADKKRREDARIITPPAPTHTNPLPDLPPLDFELLAQSALSIQSHDLTHKELQEIKILEENIQKAKNAHKALQEAVKKLDEHITTFENTYYIDLIDPTDKVSTPDHLDTKILDRWKERLA